MTLLILAAGMGSRFGGLKQMEPMGPNGEFIIDYSIYDAIRAGFKKCVFVIKEEMYDDFRNTIGKRIEGKIEVEYVFQRVDDIPVDLEVKRDKPWGTGQAILSAIDVVNENFLVINADDFYGKNAFREAYNFLEKHSGNEFGMICYKAINTITLNGVVKRGVCDVDKGYLVRIRESLIEKRGNVIHGKTLAEEEEYDIDFNHPISMSLLLFTPNLFNYLKEDFVLFFEKIKNASKDEFLITDVIDKHIRNGNITMEAMNTDCIWHGVTYKEDTEEVRTAIKKLVDEGEYPYNLWNN